MRKVIIGGISMALIAVAVTGGLAIAGSDEQFSARLGGFQEIPTISTSGHGTFSATLQDDELHFTLSYWGLTGAAIQAHIHLGRIATAGGVSAFLCGGTGEACPPGDKGKVTVTGVITADDVIGPSTQGIEAGEMDEILAAMGANAAYVNVHTPLYPTGEIRGQVRQE